MKQAKVKVPFFLNDRNMEYLLSGAKVINLDEVHEKMLFQNGVNIYIPRKYDPNRPVNEYPDISDTIVGKAIRYIEGTDNNYLEIELLDSLYYHKLKEPCIKINGYCVIEGGNITIKKITRLTLADRNATVEEVL
jgi:hypothetical protein